ncbi:MAG: preprotein translocase subunit SecG [Clostridia bacterium]|nr:preprotein translocase subunit SecG [Clostridia bacterium]
MAWYEVVFGCALIVLAIFITIIVLLQKSNDDGLSGAIVGGSSDTFYGKNKGRTRDAKLAKITKILAVAFFVVVLAASFVMAIFK